MEHKKRSRKNGKIARRLHPMSSVPNKTISSPLLSISGELSNDIASMGPDSAQSAATLPTAKSVPSITYFRLKGSKYQGPLYGQEEVRYDYMRGHHSITILMPYPTKKEIENYRRGKVDIGTSVIDGITHIVFRAGDLPWQDMPYRWHLVPTMNRLTPFLDGSTENDPIIIFIVNSATGEIDVVRCVQPPREYYEALRDAILAEEELPMQTRNEYDMKVRRVQSTWSTVSIVRLALEKYVVTICEDYV